MVLCVHLLWGRPPEARLKFVSRAGLIYYLPHEAAHRLVASIGSMAAPGSILQFDYMNIEALKGRGKGFPGFQVTAKVWEINLSLKECRQ